MGTLDKGRRQNHPTIGNFDVSPKFSSVPPAELATGNTSWADITEEEDWSAKHSAAKLSKTDVKLEDLLVASCSEDGSVRTWRPLEVSTLVFFCSFLFGRKITKM